MLLYVERLSQWTGSPGTRTGLDKVSIEFERITKYCSENLERDEATVQKLDTIPARRPFARNSHASQKTIAPSSTVLPRFKPLRDNT